LLLMIYLLHHSGIQGLTIARVCYGAVALLVYLPLLRRLRVGARETTTVSSLTSSYELKEGAKP
jgi:hypothetical protein